MDPRNFWKMREANVYSMVLQKEELALAEKNEILELLPDLRGKNVLDLASGIGRYTRPLAAQAKHLTSTDLVDQFVEKNRRNHADLDNVSYLCSDAMNLTFEDEAFDFVFSNWLFLYLNDSEAALLLSRIGRWLTSSGELFLRESCEAVRREHKIKNYSATYRTALEYERLLHGFQVKKEGSVQSYIDLLADPFQLYWHCVMK